MLSIVVNIFGLEVKIYYKYLRRKKDRMWIVVGVLSECIKIR